MSYLHVEENTVFNSNIAHAAFNPLKTFNFGLKNGFYWVKIDHLPHKKDNIIRVEGHHIASLTGYSSRNVMLNSLNNVRYPSLYVPPQASFPLYLKIQVNHEAYFPIHFYSRTALKVKQQETIFGLGLFYGALLFISVVMVILFIVTGEDNFWTYAILLLSIGIALAFRDNIPYFFGWKDAFYYDLELASHVLIGIFGGYFAFSFIYLKSEKSRFGKFFIFAFAALATLGMFSYWFLGDFIWYALADVFIFLSILSLWIVSFSLKGKTAHLYWVFGIFAVNIYFIFEFLVLYNFGLTLLNLSPLIIKIGLLIEMFILCFALLNDWHSFKQKTLAMRMELKKRSEEIQLLSQYKREDDLKDTYLENLIENHNLTNLEVKILQMLSMHNTESQIAEELHLTISKLRANINTLYAKIGISEKPENGLF